MSLPRSHLEIKLLALIFLAVLFIINIINGNLIKINKNILYFYCAIASIGLIWSLIGIINSNNLNGVFDFFRLYFLWSLIFIFLLTNIKINGGLDLVHNSIVASGIIISAINFIGLTDYYFGTSIFSSDFLTKINFIAGFHEGYVQITSHNIGSLFFLTPYLFCYNLQNYLHKKKSMWALLSLILCVSISTLSGRRALWICIFLTPIIFFCIVIFLKNKKSLYLKLIFKISIIFLIKLIVLFYLLNIYYGDQITGTVEHLLLAFSAGDERSLQSQPLLNGFYKNMFYGSGFGGQIDYIRSELQPWMFELTYHQILFNFGILGVAFILIIFIRYLYLSLKLIQEKDNPIVEISIIAGLLSFMLGSYSNPYFASFDFLLYIGMLPLVASYYSGFNYEAK
jgi:hypothetical protein